MDFALPLQTSFLLVRLIIYISLPNKFARLGDISLANLDDKKID